MRLKPAWAQAHLALGHFFFRQARYADAERAFGRAATHAPDSVEALFNLATSRDRQRRWGDAIPPLKQAREIAPDNEEIWFALRGHLLAVPPRRGSVRGLSPLRAACGTVCTRRCGGAALGAYRSGDRLRDQVSPAGARLAVPAGGERLCGRRGRAGAVLRRFARSAVARLPGARSRPPGRARIDRRFRRAAHYCRNSRCASATFRPISART